MKIKEHLSGVNETYLEHMFQAFTYGVKMIGGGVAVILHALLPSIFQSTASRVIAELYEELQARRAGRDAGKIS